MSGTSSEVFPEGGVGTEGEGSVWWREPHGEAEWGPGMVTPWRSGCMGEGGTWGRRRRQKLGGLRWLRISTSSPRFPALVESRAPLSLCCPQLVDKLCFLRSGVSGEKAILKAT